MKLLASSAALLLSLATAYPASRPAAGSVPPSQDPFYHEVPANLGDLELGDVIDYRKVNLPRLPPINRAWQIKFRSENSFGKPIHAITTLVIPVYADQKKVVTLAPWEDVSFQDCAPSFFMTSNKNLVNMFTDFSEIYTLMLARGWVVNYPDHQGPNSSFVAGPLEGKITLDSIRAVQKFTNVSSMPKNFQNALWGYSGGSIPVGWAAELQPSYAPEIKIVLAASGGNVVNPESVFKFINKSPFAGFLVPGILGLASEYTTLWDYIWMYLRPEKASKFLKGLSTCLPGDLLNYFLQDILSEYFTIQSFLDLPAVQDVLKANTMGKSIPTIPRYIYQGALDEIQPIKDVDALVKFYCAGGANVEYDRTILGHATLEVARLATSMIKIDEAFHGKILRGCHVPASINDAAPSAAEIWNATLQDAALMHLPVNFTVGQPSSIDSTFRSTM